jgi:hypothetical protein
MSKFPQSNLSPKSQPWGRNIENSISNLASSVRLNNSNIGNNLKQINSTVNLLNRQQENLLENQEILLDNQEGLIAQQEYFATFKTYISTSSTFASSSVINSWINLASINLSFTLTRTSVVLISSFGNVSSDSYGVGINGPVGVEWENRTTINGSTYVAKNGINISLPQFNSAVEVDDDSVSKFQTTVTLPAGSYTISSSWHAYNNSRAGATGSIVSIDYKNLSASVIG